MKFSTLLRIHDLLKADVERTNEELRNAQSDFAKFCDANHIFRDADVTDELTLEYTTILAKKRKALTSANDAANCLEDFEHQEF